MRYLLLALALCLAHDAQAGPVLGIGLGKGIVRNQFGAHESFERGASIGWRFGDSFYIKPEVGAYLSEGRYASTWLSAIGGFGVKTASGLAGYLGVGPTWLTRPDNTALSGHFQFNVQAGACIAARVMLCFTFTHLSNAGLVMPNRGLDLIGVGVELP